MKKLLQSELFVVANLISFVALFCADFILIISDNYNPIALGTNVPHEIMMWIMLFNIVCLLCSIGSLELDNRK